jgi:hypothetical protein
MVTLFATAFPYNRESFPFLQIEANTVNGIDYTIQCVKLGDEVFYFQYF